LPCRTPADKDVPVAKKPSSKDSLGRGPGKNLSHTRGVKGEIRHAVDPKELKQKSPGKAFAGPIQKKKNPGKSFSRKASEQKEGQGG